MQDEILRDLVALGATLDTFGGSNKIVAKLEIPKKTDINVQLAQIERAPGSRLALRMRGQWLKYSGLPGI